MYRRFLNNDDYLGIITPEALAQLTRGNDARFIQAEESAEMSIVEYLSENYEIEKELAKGKYIAEYDHRITYPVGVHVYFEGQIHEVIRSVSGYRKPATAIYWEECSDIHVDAGQVVNYNLKKHMVRLAIYELTKLIAPNNVSVVRMRDYEDSMKWLNDAAKLRLNPQIPRKVDDTKKPVTDWQLATFQTDYDPYRNPWLT